ncbi:MAG: phosphotransferase, partial [Pseudomonadota bacterium]
MTSAAAASCLTGTGWEDAKTVPMAQDASARRYHRLLRPDGATAILCQDPSDESRTAFVKLSSHLISLGLSAPKVILADANTGQLLLEDLGNLTFPHLLAECPNRENSLYSAAIDALLVVSSAPPPDIEPFEIDEMAEQAMLAFDLYGGPAPAGFQLALSEMLTAHVGPAESLMLRDVHADNLMWLPNRSGPAQVGLLDFQDARLAQPLYDIVSLIEDARRDVGR